MKKLLVILLSTCFISFSFAVASSSSHHHHKTKATVSHPHTHVSYTVHKNTKNSNKQKGANHHKSHHSSAVHKSKAYAYHHGSSNKNYHSHRNVAMTSDVVPPVISGASIAPRVVSYDNQISTPNTVDINSVARQPRLYSHSALVMDPATGKVFVSKNPDAKLPIASISKLMTAMVVLDSGVDMDDYVTISQADIDLLRNTYSRLKVGMQFRRRDLLLLALMSSENRAAHALARTTFTGGTNTFIAKMNEKARSLGMNNTQFFDPTGLTDENQSTAIDLSRMVQAAYNYDLIRKDTTTRNADVALGPRYVHQYINSDALVRADRFEIALSKTGFINQSGHCLVLYSIVKNHPIVMVFLNSAPKNGRIADALAARNYISDRIVDNNDSDLRQVDYNVSSK